MVHTARWAQRGSRGGEEAEQETAKEGEPRQDSSPSRRPPCRTTQAVTRGALREGDRRCSLNAILKALMARKKTLLGIVSKARHWPSLGSRLLVPARVRFHPLQVFGPFPPSPHPRPRLQLYPRIDPPTPIHLSRPRQPSPRRRRPALTDISLTLDELAFESLLNSSTAVLTILYILRLPGIPASHVLDGLVSVRRWRLAMVPRPRGGVREAVGRALL